MLVCCSYEFLYINTIYNIYLFIYNKLVWNNTPLLESRNYFIFFQVIFHTLLLFFPNFHFRLHMVFNLTSKSTKFSLI